MVAFDLKDKAAIVTGGAGGIGKVLCEKLLGRGAKVCVSDIKLEECEAVAAELEEKYGNGRVLAVHLDVTEDQSYKGALNLCKEAFGSVDIVINNAAIFSELKIASLINVNLVSVIRGTELAMQAMKEDGTRGVVINMGSLAGFAETPTQAVYASSKAGVIHYTRSIGAMFHYEDSGVRVMCLCPGATETAMLRRVHNYAATERDREVLKKIVDPVPVQRPEAVGDAVLKMIDEAESGAVAVIEEGRELYYVAPNKQPQQWETAGYLVS